jgi:ketosteroid isomerase-like protein
MNAMVVTGGARPRGSVWLVGIARNAKLGAAIEVEESVILCGDRSAWPADLRDRPVVVAGRLVTQEAPPLPIGPQGERSAGAEGSHTVLAHCAAPLLADDGLLAAEHALFAALATRDRDALERLVGDDFVLRLPGQPDTDRSAFLQGVMATPGEILGIEGEGLAAHVSGDTGIVRGVQLAHVRLDGQLIDDRGAFADVFARRGGAWKLTFALVVPGVP